MRSKFKNSKSNGSPHNELHGPPIVKERQPSKSSEDWTRSSISLLGLCFVILNASWAVYYHQFDNMPAPLNATQAGNLGFSEQEAMKHVKALVSLGPHPVGSKALVLAVQYVLDASNEITKRAHSDVDVNVHLFHVKSGVNQLVSGLFTGKTLLYADLSHIVLGVFPKYTPEAGENAILVSSHIDTVFSAAGAGDCSSCVAVVLELARAVSHCAYGFKNGVIFLLNTGEEEGLNGAHSFITQHPWSRSISIVVDLEAMGVGGKSSIFQAGPNPWAVENFAKVAKYPSAQVLSQDIFSFGAIKSATDFQIYKEVGGLSGLDFAYLDRTAVYHTKNDALEFLRSGSLQHLGENMLAFLVHAGASYAPQETGDDPAVYFDVLGKYMVVYRLSFAELLHSSVIVQSLLVWCASLFMGGRRAVLSFLLSVVSLVLMWAFSIGFSLASALFIVPLISWAPVPYVANPWLAIGFFGSPSVVGAFLGQHMGYRLLIMCLSRHENGSETAKLEAERWLFKAGFLPWLVLLIFGTYYRIGSSYLALVWLVSPAFSYGLLEASLIPRRSLRTLKSGTLILGLALPVLVSAGVIVRLVGTLIGGVVRFDRNPGGVPECLPNVIIGTAVAVISCLTLVFALSYFHLSGAKGKMILASSLLFFVSVLASLSGIAPPFTPTVSRPVNVVHVVDAGDGSAQPLSYISLFSNTPGKLTRERDAIDEGFVCGRDRVVDFVTFSAEYSCWRDVSASGGRDDDGWSRSDVPTMRVRGRTPTSAAVSIHTKQSTRWSLAVDMRQIEDFTIDEPMVSRGEKREVDGWHLVQFSGGEKGPDAFNLTVFWSRSAAGAATLKLRTDFSRVTPPIHRLLPKLPPWCSFFGDAPLFVPSH